MIVSGGPVTFTNSTLRDNSAGNNGGAINAASVTATNSVVSSNTTSLGSGGGIAAGGPVTLTNSTVSGNTARDGDGGGAVTRGQLNLENSTISGNTATGSGGGLFAGTVTLVYATVVGNSAPSAANIGATADTLVPFGSVIALPQGGGANCVVDVTTSNGYNFSDDASCQLSGTTDRQSDGDPGLTALANNGGLTQTRLPQSGSPLIDAIPVASCQSDGAGGITTDQRGVTRPQGAGCDIGAVDVAEAPPTPGAAVPMQAVVRFTG